MLRILVVVFFWLCAIGLLSLSIWSEVNNLQRGSERPAEHANAHSQRPVTR
jgi:hypothetical protein